MVYLTVGRVHILNTVLASLETPVRLYDDVRFVSIRNKWRHVRALNALASRGQVNDERLSRCLSELSDLLDEVGATYGLGIYA